MYVKMCVVMYDIKCIIDYGTSYHPKTVCNSLREHCLGPISALVEGPCTVKALCTHNYRADDNHPWVIHRRPHSKAGLPQWSGWGHVNVNLTHRRLDMYSR